MPTASRHDSQDLCFLAGEDYRNFLQRNASEILTPGEIVATDGTIVGEHNGLANYTIGQRKGLGIAAGVPLYVIAKDAKNNRLLVGRGEDPVEGGHDGRHQSLVRKEIPQELGHPSSPASSTSSSAWPSAQGVTC